VLRNTTVERMWGEDHLAKVELLNQTGERRILETPALFSFIGAAPRTEWLPDDIATDPKGFVLTGPAVKQSLPWVGRREPFLLETSRAGVFAAGDVRCGSIKRVASAVGEGAMAVQFVHEHLKGM
jgi:thioredoxin reductase (NADPH)